MRHANEQESIDYTQGKKEKTVNREFPRESPGMGLLEKDFKSGIWNMFKQLNKSNFKEIF